MRAPRIAIVFLLLVSLPFLLASPGRTAHQPQPLNSTALFYPPLVAEYHGNGVGPRSEKLRADNQKGGIREEIPAKYATRYQEWKKEFVSTEFGSRQWEFYQNNPNLTLTIKISRDNAEGATTGQYKWNETGQLVAATIALGFRLDEGYPNPIYFPVMNSLVLTEATYKVGGATLAATKLAHEFGHVNRTAKADPTLYRLQTALTPHYNEIFLSNGRNPNDPRLIDLARQIGGTPVEIWEDREYWGEANAMLYLRDRFTEDSLRCSLFNRIRHSVGRYAKSYERRFLEIAQSTPSRSPCGWQ